MVLWLKILLLIGVMGLYAAWNLCVIIYANRESERILKEIQEKEGSDNEPNQSQ